MKYTVDIDPIINKMLKDNSGICQYYQRIRCFYSHPFEFWDDFMWDVYRDSFGALEARYVLNNKSAFISPLHHIMFRSFVAAEQKFITNYIPQNSHEERLTGHLVSELENSLFILQDTFELFSQEIYAQKVPVEFYYADLSSNNYEKCSGSDLGLIFHINLPDSPETFRVAAIQAKKMKNAGATIDIAQKETLLKQYGEMAYYMFYDMTDEHNSPLIQKASRINIPDDKSGIFDTYSYGKENIVGSNGGAIPLSLFLIFDILNPYKQTSIKSIWDATNVLLYGRDSRGDYSDVSHRHHRPSRILTVSIGGISNNHNDLRNLSDLFRNEYPKD